MLAVVLAGLTAAAALVGWLATLGTGRTTAVAAVRATIQLAAASVVITVAVRHLATALLPAHGVDGGRAGREEAAGEAGP